MNILTSRFNTSTWKENCEYREKIGHTGSLYCSPQKITEKIPLNALAYVVEMNNSTNQILGIGLIRNALYHGKRLNVYEVNNYNRYNYKGNYRLDREIIQNTYPQIVIILEQILFKGKTHLKRGSGLISISEKIFIQNKILEKFNYTEYQIREELSILFKRHFSEETINT